jgi:hypothetical protein
MLKRCDDKTMAAGTIAAGALGEPYDVRLNALWHQKSIDAALPRRVRVELVS